MPAGPAFEVAHMGTQTGFVHHRDFLGLGVRRHLAIVCVDVCAVSIGVEQVAVGFAARTDA
jgi:hypothetical protein